tara:strand:- start:435 stop:1181 length:747 start_codon:yes stop_codon:yes gene_type:complete
VIEIDKTDLLSKGRNCFERGDFKRAFVIYNELLESSDPVDERTTLVECYFQMGNIFHHQGEIGKAIKAFNKVIELEPGHTDASISLSVLYNDIGHYESAKKVFVQANERVKAQGASGGVEDAHVNKKFAGKHLEIAEMYMSYNRYDEALFEYNKVVALDPKNFGVRVSIAKVYAKKNFMAKAFDELKRLKNEEPNYMEARVALGVLYYGCGQILEAQSEWERVLAKEPTNSEAAMYINLSRTATETRI